MERYRGTAILAAAFAAVIDIACYPVVAPAIACAVAGAAFDWMGWLDAIGFDLWAAFWTSGEWLGHVPLMLAGFALTFLALFGYSVAKEGEHAREVDRGIYGDARVVSGATELNRKNDFWSGSGAPERAGLVLGATERGYWFDSSVPHAMTCGKTGSGKTQLQVLETMHLLMAAGWNIVSTGKPEVLELTADKARGMGYEAVVLDLTGYPGASRYNPIGLVADAVEAGNIDSAVRTARQVAVDLIPLGGEKNTYFPKAARNMLAACILVVCTADIPRNQKNLASVAALVDRGTAGEDPKDPSAPLRTTSAASDRRTRHSRRHPTSSETAARRPPARTSSPRSRRPWASSRTALFARSRPRAPSPSETSSRERRFCTSRCSTRATRTGSSTPASSTSGGRWRSRSARRTAAACRTRRRSCSTRSAI